MILLKFGLVIFSLMVLGGSERANLVLQCLSRLHDVGVLVVSLTFDGSS